MLLEQVSGTIKFTLGSKEIGVDATGCIHMSVELGGGSLAYVKGRAFYVFMRFPACLQHLHPKPQVNFKESQEQDHPTQSHIGVVPKMVGFSS